MDEKIAKGPRSQMSAPAIRSKIDRKLHCLAGLAHSGLSALAEWPRDIKARTGDQRLANTEVKDQRLTNIEVEGQRSEGQKNSESELGGFRIVGSGPELENK